ncbi:argonaute-like protein [Desarmillaria ectypa]|nr:argonaute-like protein [Desarmillaria ectypa]
MAPPRMAPGQRGGSPYSATGVAPQQHGGPPRGRGGRRGGGVAGPQGSPSISISSAVQAVGVCRPGFGMAGRQITVGVNACEMNIPDIMVYHYDGKISSSIRRDGLHVSTMEKSFRAAFNLKLIEALQSQYPDVFIKAAAYDGKKNLYTSYKLDFGAKISCQYDVTWTEGSRVSNFKITLTEARAINMEVLRRYTAGQQSSDENVSTALTALNIVLRMEPSLDHPFRVRSFYSDKIKAPLASMPLEVWQGYFQSVRPALNRLIVAIDISTGVMFKLGSLVETCVEFLSGDRRGDPNMYLRASGPQALPPAQRRRLQNFLFGVKVEAESAAGGKRLYSIQKLTERDAALIVFMPAGGQQTTVAQYYAQANQRIRFPNIICMQRCYIVPGQLSRAELNLDATWAMAGIQVLAYGRSSDVRDFGLDIKTGSLPMEIPARMLNAPELKYGPGSKQPTVRSRGGAWNLVEKKIFRPMPLGAWIVVIFVPQNCFSQNEANRTISGLIQGCEAIGMMVQDRQPLCVYKDPQSVVDKSISDAISEARARRNTMTEFIVCILSDGSNADLYTAVKFSCDIKRGVANQCLRVGKCINARPQYWANVTMKINAKLGGVNVIPDPKSVSIISDPKQPTIVMGAHVMHPAPGSQSPSYAAAVANIDSDGVRYASKTEIQLWRQVMIEDLRTMAKDLLISYICNRTKVEGVKVLPKRLIFFRDGVSEDEFKRALDLELPLLRAACADAKISPPPKITFIVEYGFNADTIQAISNTLCYARSTCSVSIPTPVYYAHIVCSRAKTHYDPQGASPSGVSGGSQTREETLAQHQEQHQEVHDAQAMCMYFMVSNALL